MNFRSVRAWSGVVLLTMTFTGGALSTSLGAGASRNRSGLRVVVGGGSELQNPADRLDSPTIPAGIDVANYFFARPSSSVAKKIDASFKISLARRRSRTSRSSSLRRWRSSVVSPGRRPPSI